MNIPFHYLYIATPSFHDLKERIMSIRDETTFKLQDAERILSKMIILLSDERDRVLFLKRGMKYFIRTQSRSILVTVTK